jgi:hypothetical protein
VHEGLLCGQKGSVPTRPLWTVVRLPLKVPQDEQKSA